MGLHSHLGEIVEESQYELGDTITVHAESIGKPGERFFRLLVEATAGSACIWLEKEQLLQLAVAIQRLLATTNAGSSSDEVDPVSKFDSQVNDLEFKGGKIVLEQMPGDTSYIFMAHDVEEADETLPAAKLRVNVRQLENLAEEAIEVCSAGRPRCQLCGKPMGSEKHICIRSNGHIKPV